MIVDLVVNQFVEFTQENKNRKYLQKVLILARVSGILLQNERKLRENTHF